MIPTRLLIVVAAASLSTMLLLGCTSNKKHPMAAQVRHNMSPELGSLSQTPQQDYNMVARSVDETSSQFWDDLAWLFLMDEPLHLAKDPIP